MRTDRHVDLFAELHSAINNKHYEQLVRIERNYYANLSWAEYFLVVIGWKSSAISISLADASAFLFTDAIAGGSLAIIIWCENQLSSNQLNKLWQTDSVKLALSHACRHGRIDLIKHFAATAPERTVQQLLTTDDYFNNLFYSTAYSGNIELMHYLLNLLPADEHGAIIEQHNFQIYREAISGGNLAMIHYLEHRFPRQLNAMHNHNPEFTIDVPETIGSTMTDAYCRAAINGNTPMLQHIEQRLQKTTSQMLRQSAYMPFTAACAGGHTNAIQYLLDRAPSLHQELLTNNNCTAYQHAVSCNRANALTLLESIATIDQWLAMHASIQHDRAWGYVEEHEVTAIERIVFQYCTTDPQYVIGNIPPGTHRTIDPTPIACLHLLNQPAVFRWVLASLPRGDFLNKFIDSKISTWATSNQPISARDIALIKAILVHELSQPANNPIRTRKILTARSAMLHLKKSDITQLFHHAQHNHHTAAINRLIGCHLVLTLKNLTDSTAANEYLANITPIAGIDDNNISRIINHLEACNDSHAYLCCALILLGRIENSTTQVSEATTEKRIHDAISFLLTTKQTNPELSQRVDHILWELSIETSHFRSISLRLASLGVDAAKCAAPSARHMHVKRKHPSITMARHLLLKAAPVQPDALGKLESKSSYAAR